MLVCGLSLAGPHLMTVVASSKVVVEIGWDDMSGM